MCGNPDIRKFAEKSMQWSVATGKCVCLSCWYPFIDCISFCSLLIRTGSVPLNANKPQTALSFRCGILSRQREKYFLVKVMLLVPWNDGARKTPAQHLALTQLHSSTGRWTPWQQLKHIISASITSASSTTVFVDEDKYLIYHCDFYIWAEAQGWYLINTFLSHIQVCVIYWGHTHWMRRVYLCVLFSGKKKTVYLANI